MSEYCRGSDNPSYFPPHFAENGVMDLATLFGFLMAWGAVLFSMFHASEGAMGSYFKPPEFFLVLGGSTGAAMLSMPLHTVTGVVSYLKKWVLNKETHIEHIIKEMVQYAETARRDGVLALETVARRAPDPFLRRGLQLTIDGTDPEIIERILRIEIESMSERHKHGKHFFGTLAKFGPGFGLMATLIAQVAMFRNLAGDAGVIGTGLGHRPDRHLYGCILQNLVAGPVAEKLGMRSHEEAFAKEIMLQGVLSIQAGNNPRVVEMQLDELPEQQAAGRHSQGRVRAQGVGAGRQPFSMSRQPRPANARKPECEECPEWIFTFADLVMLMMGFFVILWVLKPPAGKSGDGESDERIGYRLKPPSAGRLATSPIQPATIRLISRCSITISIASQNRTPARAARLLCLKSIRRGIRTRLPRSELANTRLKERGLPSPPATPR